MLMKNIEVEGYAIVPDVLNPATVASLTYDLMKVSASSAKRGGLRNLLKVPSIIELAQSAEIRDLVIPVLGEGAFVVRGILFDKTEQANWKVPWHQDVTIAVNERRDAEGFGPWSLKQGVLHVQPPSYVLEMMLSIRVHLDDCPAANGALRVLPGSHRNGKISETAVTDAVSRNESVVCEVTAGGALLMRPLLLHSSSASETVQHRRVVHLDFANVLLPSGLTWSEQSSNGN
jgi:Phytanoyl-CoA dioxygenase (PhyH)